MISRDLLKKKAFEEQLEISEALFSWFISQEVSPQLALRVMMQASGITAGQQVNSKEELYEELKQACRYFKVMAEETYDAVRTMEARKHGLH